MDIATSVDLVTDPVMVNATSQLVFEVASLVITVIVGIVGIYLKKFLTTNEYVKKYNLLNEKNERILENAIAYAEAKAKSLAKGQISKRKLALEYIDKISPELIQSEGNKLELMLDRKVEQVLNKKLGIVQA